MTGRVKRKCLQAFSSPAATVCIAITHKPQFEIIQIDEEGRTLLIEICALAQNLTCYVTRYFLHNKPERLAVECNKLLLKVELGYIYITLLLLLLAVIMQFEKTNKKKDKWVTWVQQQSEQSGFWDQTGVSTVGYMCHYYFSADACLCPRGFLLLTQWGTQTACIHAECNKLMLVGVWGPVFVLQSKHSDPACRVSYSKTLWNEISQGFVL